MNLRESTLNVLQFRKTDLIPLEPGYGRKSTIERWQKEGLPKNLNGSITEYAYRQAGGTLEWPKPERATFHLNERMIPQFEEKILEIKEDSIVVRDWKGNICEIGKEFSPEYLRNAIDFVTRRWIKCPVESREDWEDMKCRYNPDETSRIVIPTEEDFAILRRREYFFGFHFSGPFWQLREWLGFEKLCTMFYDDPILIGEMLDFWNYYVATLLRRAIEKIVPDYVYISEDMAYKCFSMISPEMTRKYLLPVWKNWGEIIRNAEIPIYAIDSDGFIGELIPIWIDAGINVCEPIEVAAGNDICAFRKKFGKNMAYRGGVDKREIAKGGNFIEKEIERIRPVIDDGGFIPSCDHGVPADVSWSNFVHYTKVLAKVTGWM